MEHNGFCAPAMYIWYLKNSYKFSNNTYTELKKKNKLSREIKCFKDTNNTF